MNFEDRMALFFKGMESLKERHEALTMNLELLHHDVLELKENSRRDGENIHALARIAEAHERRISDLEGE
jgi:vacuolar-type H+-ATPase subunit D/Vma8